MLITNIQRFSLHDGPGIRTTVFMKGCSLRCPWCSNPENLNPYPEKYTKKGINGIYGREYTCDEVYYEIIKDRAFYGSDGGVTFSGGEALLQVDSILPLVRRLKEPKITTAVETCLFAPSEKLKEIIPYIDFFYVDIKILDAIECKNIIRGNIELYKTNLDILTSKKKITVRIPVIGKYTDKEDNVNKILELLKKYENEIIKVELIKGHNLGAVKYESLGLSRPKFCEVKDEFVQKYRNAIERVIKTPVEICKI